MNMSPACSNVASSLTHTIPCEPLYEYQHLRRITTQFQVRVKHAKVMRLMYELIYHK